MCYSPIGELLNLLRGEPEDLIDILQAVRITAQREVRQRDEERCDVLY